MFKAIAIGRLCADPVTREVAGSQCTSFRLACETAFKGEDGKYATHFVNVAAWGKLGERCASLTKGKRVYAMGNYGIRPYKDKNGNDAFSYEMRADDVQFLDLRAANDDPFNS